MAESSGSGQQSSPSKLKILAISNKTAALTSYYRPDKARTHQVNINFANLGSGSEQSLSAAGLKGGLKARAGAWGQRCLTSSGGRKSKKQQLKVNYSEQCQGVDSEIVKKRMFRAQNHFVNLNRLSAQKQMSANKGVIPFRTLFSQVKEQIVETCRTRMQTAPEHLICEQVTSHTRNRHPAAEQKNDTNASEIFASTQTDQLKGGPAQSVGQLAQEPQQALHQVGSASLECSQEQIQQAQNEFGQWSANAIRTEQDLAGRGPKRRIQSSRSQTLHAFDRIDQPGAGSSRGQNS